ncbi:hypothetical protein ISS07_05400, partial [Candidatus Woesearchaeota archaeon]|nr:hypothetical protein [Candidatus Woesearchaeota archaeon]
MKITIDTKEDSHEEIKNIISMLSSLVGSKAISSVSEEKEIVSNKGDIFSQGPSEETYAESPSESSDVPDNPQPSNVFSMF